MASLSGRWKITECFIRENRVKKRSSEPNAVIERATSGSRAIGSRPLFCIMVLAAIHGRTRWLKNVMQCCFPCLYGLKPKSWPCTFSAPEAPAQCFHLRVMNCVSSSLLCDHASWRDQEGGHQCVMKHRSIKMKAGGLFGEENSSGEKNYGENT